MKRSNEGKGTNIPKKNVPKNLSTERHSNIQKDKPIEKTEVSERAQTIKRRDLKSAPTISKLTRNSGCPHYLGYLRNRPKNATIPNRCLTCSKVMECSLGVSGSEISNRRREC